MGERQGTNHTPILVGVAVAILVAGALVWFLMPGDHEGHITGTVTLENKPLPGAQVVFLGEDEKNRAPIVSQTDDQGQYRLIGNKGRGIPVGKYKVVVTKQALPDGSVPQGERLEQARSQGLLKNFVPKIYEDRSTTLLSFDIQAGAQTVDLKLTKQP